MLRRNHDVLDFDRLAIAILDGDLGFTVRAQEISLAAFADFG
jgi:hypothetical protein